MQLYVALAACVRRDAGWRNARAVTLCAGASKEHPDRGFPDAVSVRVKGAHFQHALDIQ